MNQMEKHTNDGPAGVPAALAGAATSASPCIAVCRIDEKSGLCTGCLRSLDEIAGWAAYDSARRQAINAGLPARRLQNVWPRDLSIAPLNRAPAPELQRRIDQKTKPPGSLGRLEGLALQLGLMQQSPAPEIRRPALLVFAGDHGVTAEGVSPYPSEVTAQMIGNFLSGGAAASVFARESDLQLAVIDAGVDAELPFEDRASELAPDASAQSEGLQPLFLNRKVRRGSRNFVRESALGLEELREALARGRELARDWAHARGANLLAFGEMGIGNTSSATLLHALLAGLPVAELTGRGAGLDAAGLAHKISVLERAQARILKRHPLLQNLAEAGAERDDFLPAPAAAALALQEAGGLEIAMLCGAILGGAEAGVALLIDGYICTAAALCAATLAPAARDWMIFAHRSRERGHGALLDFLEAEPLLDLDLRLGEGSGAALALPLLRQAAAFLSRMASFEEAGVSEKRETDE